MEKDLKSWSNRDLTPFGKVTVIKTLIISKIVHLLIALPTPSTKIINEINTMFYNFLWDGKPDKMRRSLAKHKILEGGIGMIDLTLFDQALKLTWIMRIFKHPSRWKDLIDVMYPNFKNIVNFGSLYIKNFLGDIENPFWKNVMTYYHTFNKQFDIKTKEEMEANSFLYNEHIKVGNRAITKRCFY